MNNKKLIRYINYGLVGIAAVTALDVIPFVAPELSALILGLAVVLQNGLLKVADYLDDGKLNDSFQRK